MSGELVRRGVRALEAFGVPRGVRAFDAGAVDPELAPSIAALGDCSFELCMIDANFLLDMGFTVVAPHPYFRVCALELDKGPGGRRRSRPRWSGCWNRPSCRGFDRRRFGRGGSDLNCGAPVFHGLLVRQQLSERESPCGTVVLPSRYNRFTAARMPSAMASRHSRVTKRAWSCGLVM